MLRKRIGNAGFIIFLIIPLLISVSCASAGTNSLSAGHQVKKTESWKIEFTISGGFAGIHRHLTLNSDGKLTAADKKLKKHAEKQISQKQLMEIANIIEQPGFLVNEKEASRLGWKCADCFQYRLMLSVNDKKATAIFNDLTLQDSKYAALIKLLSTMLEQALKD